MIALSFWVSIQKNRPRLDIGPQLEALSAKHDTAWKGVDEPKMIRPSDRFPRFSGPRLRFRG
jgi:hypothetical protein